MDAPIYYTLNNLVIKETNNFMLRVGFLGKHKSLPFIETRPTHGITKAKSNYTFISEESFKQAYGRVISILNLQANILL